MYRVEFKYWTLGSGYSHSETVDNVKEFTDAESYWKNIDDPESWLSGYDGINIEVYAEDNTLVSEFFVEA